MDEGSVLTAKGISQAEELGQWLKARLFVGFKDHLHGLRL